MITKTLIVFLVLPFLAQATILDRHVPIINYVSFPVFDGQNTYNISAQFRLPRSESQSDFPAVVILHTTGGIDSTGSFYIKALNRAGIATLEVDMWGGRGITGNVTDRPPTPQLTVPDAFSALAFLAARDDIQADKIGIIGFSWGGVVSLLSATEAYQNQTGSELKFAAHVANYPVCWLYNTIPGFELVNLTGSPVLIQSAQLDDYDQPESCANALNSLTEVERNLVTYKQYKYVYHTFDRLQPTKFFEDPAAYLGQGGTVKLSPNIFAAYKSRRKVTQFFLDAFSN